MVEWSIFNEIFAVAFNVLYFVIIIGTIFIVILDNRNPVKTMAWVLVLFFLPIVGLVFYFFFFVFVLSSVDGIAPSTPIPRYFSTF